MTHFRSGSIPKRHLRISAAFFVQQHVPENDVIADYVHVHSIWPNWILASIAGYIIPPLKSLIYFRLNLLDRHLFRGDVFCHSDAPFDTFDGRFVSKLF